jgi:hypothetical protein
MNTKGFDATSEQGKGLRFPGQINELSTLRDTCCWEVRSQVLSRLGFDEANVTQLEEELLAIARVEEVEDFITSPHGAKYIVDGSMKTPQGGVVRVRTIWIIETEQENPRFVTAYPIE